MPKVYGYGRASTTEQEDTTAGQEREFRQAFEAKLKVQGYEFGGWYCDRGVSGSVPLQQRPEGVKALACLEKGDCFVVRSLDRGWRSTQDFCYHLEKFKKKGVRLILLTQDIDTGSPAGLAMAQMLAVFGEFERRMIGERMKQFQAHRRSTGRPWGPPPLGYKNAGPKGQRRFVVDHEFVELVKKIYEWHKQGHSAERIYWHLRNNRINNPRNGKPIEADTTIKVWLRWYKKQINAEKGVSDV